MLALKCRLLGHLVNDSRRFRSLSLMDVGPSEHFNVLVKQNFQNDVSAAFDENVRDCEKYKKCTEYYAEILD